MTNPARTDINVRSSTYLIAHTVGTCWHCSASTRLFALALPPGHEVLEADDDARDDEIANDTWSVVRCNAFLFSTEYVSDAVRLRLHDLTQFYRLSEGETGAGCYWANYCERCGSLLNDHELFCEPDVAFVPTSEASAGLIRLLSIDESIEAVASGYACDPLFFDSMAKG